jgi:hypothetical protein
MSGKYGFGGGIELPKMDSRSPVLLSIRRR